MLDLSWSELAVIGLVGILVIGPEELPVVLRTVRGWMQSLKRVSHEFTDMAESVTRESGMDELKKEAEVTRRIIHDANGNAYESYDVGEIEQELEAFNRRNPADKSQSTPPTSA